jgi:hypothetical protein
VQTSQQPLPRLCYVGSLPVEGTSASMILLHRLLETYPADRLRITHTWEEADATRHPERRLPGVRYLDLPPRTSRGWFFARMRLPGVFLLAARLRARERARRIHRWLGGFEPEAILTIHEQFGWMAAETLAHSTSAALHLVLHDEWFRNLPMAPSLRPRFEAGFRGAYRAAASRLCVCPYMEEAYRGRFGAPGTVLYPALGRDAPDFAAPPAQLTQPRASLEVAYGGNVFPQGYWDALTALADALRSLPGRLHLYGPSPEAVQRQGLARPEVIAGGFVRNLAAHLRESAQVLFLPMTFERREEPNMRVSFPSKLAEYTATGLPLLIQGPEYCSAVRWARAHPGVAEVVTTPGVAPLSAALGRLQHPAHRAALASQALAIGRQLFRPAAAEQIFHTALRAA